jgi:hypothetical protein
MDKSNDLIFYTAHAKEKFKILKEQGFLVKRKWVEDTIKFPEIIDHSQMPLLIAQKTIDEKHVLRVVFKKENGIIKIITFYPARKRRLKPSMKDEK